jgi:hypothetical protein
MVEGLERLGLLVLFVVCCGCKEVRVSLQRSGRPGQGGCIDLDRYTTWVCMNRTQSRATEDPKDNPFDGSTR